MRMPRASTSKSTTPSASRRTTRLSTTTDTSTSTKKAATTQTATPASMKPHKTTSRRRARTVGQARATDKAVDLLAANGITSSIFRQSQIHWMQARMIAKHHEDCWTNLVSNWNLATSTKQNGYRKQGRPAKRWNVDLNITCNLPDPTATANSSKWDAMESDFIGSRLTQPARPTTAPYHHDYNNPTNNARSNNKHDQGSRPKRRRH